MGQQGEDQARWAPSLQTPPLPTHLGSPKKPNSGNPQGWGARRGSRFSVPAPQQRAQTGPSRVHHPSSSGRHLPPRSLTLTFAPAGPWAGRGVLGTQGPSTRPHPPPPVTGGSGSVVLRRPCPRASTQVGVNLSTPWSPHQLGRGWTQATGCRMPAGSRPRGCARNEVARRGCGPGPLPLCLAGPALCRPLAPGPAGLAVSPSAHLLGQVLGGAPRRVQTFAQPSPPAAPGHLPQPEDHWQAPGVTSGGFVGLGAEGRRPYRLRGVS